MAKPALVNCPPPAPLKAPLADRAICAFLRALGTEALELVSPAFVITTLVPSIVIPRSLFKNLLVLV